METMIQTGAVNSTNDYHQIPATSRQLEFANALARKSGQDLPHTVQEDRRMLSAWIEEQLELIAQSRTLSLPSAKQISFAERISRSRNRPIPYECFQDRKLLSRWIDRNR